MKIAVAGTVCRPIECCTFGEHNEVVALDTVPEKVEMINNQKLPIVDSEIESF